MAIWQAAYSRSERHRQLHRTRPVPSASTWPELAPHSLRSHDADQTSLPVRRRPFILSVSSCVIIVHAKRVAERP